MRYPLASTTWDRAEIAAIERVIASGMYSMGEEVAAFERAFADFVGSRYCVMVNSGSSANLLMIAALRYRKDGPGLPPGAEVIVPAVSWSTTYNPLYQYGLKLRFVDIDGATLNLDTRQIEAAWTPNSRAILAVNLLGNPNDFDVLRAFAKERDLILLEDNCEFLGATYAGKHCGAIGLMGTYSAFFSHHISTMEGGMVVTDDEELYHIVLSLRAHGWTRNLPKLNRVSNKGDDPFSESFRFVLPGYNVRPIEMSGAIGLEQLKKLPAMIDQRRANARRFQDLMQGFQWLQTQRELGESSWFGFSMVVDPSTGISRADLLSALDAAGIGVRPIVAGNFAKNDVMQWFDYSVAGALANADRVDRNGLFIGNHHYPLDEELALLGQVLTDLSRERQL